MSSKSIKDSSRTAAKKRPLGRPAGRSDGELVKQQLLDAAHQLFLSYEFKAVSVRQIADIAGVNGAMVNYYFGGKKGLYLAMVEQVIASMEEPLKKLQQQKNQSVNDFVRAYMDFLASNTWWPNFMIREVLFGEEEFRETILEKFSKTFAMVLIQAIGHEVKEGKYRNDLQPELATWSLMGMMIFPFLSRPIAKRVLQKDFDEQMVSKLISHTCELFNKGVAKKPGGESHGS